MQFSDRFLCWFLGILGTVLVIDSIGIMAHGLSFRAVPETLTSQSSFVLGALVGIPLGYALRSNHKEK